MSKILVIDDEPEILDNFKEYLEYKGHTVFTTPTGEEGLEIFQKNGVDFLILDIHLPGMNGIQVMKEVKKTHPALPSVLITGYHPDEYKKEIKGIEACFFLRKPISLEDLDKILLQHLSPNA